jgi:hypothetical protein
MGASLRSIRDPVSLPVIWVSTTRNFKLRHYPFLGQRWSGRRLAGHAAMTAPAGPGSKGSAGDRSVGGKSRDEAVRGPWDWTARRADAARSQHPTERERLGGAAGVLPITCCLRACFGWLMLP